MNNDRWRSTAVDLIADCCVAFLMYVHWWTPIGQIVQLDIETAWDATLNGATVTGVIRAYDLDSDRALSRLLIELDGQQTRGNSADELHWIVAERCLHKRRASRLLLYSSFIARIVDAPSFVDSEEKFTIGIAVCTRAGQRSEPRHHQQQARNVERTWPTGKEE